MLTPEALLSHARRLLTAATDEADLRRATSAAYYSVFDMLISEAAATQAGASPPVRDSVRRSIDHGDVRKVCMAINARPGARPAVLQRLLTEPVSSQLIDLTSSVLALQDARLTADYDLHQTVPPAAARLRAAAAVNLAETVFDIWPSLSLEPDTRTFLTALLFYNRWTRRP